MPQTVCWCYTNSATGSEREGYGQALLRMNLIDLSKVKLGS